MTRSILAAALLLATGAGGCATASLDPTRVYFVMAGDQRELGPLYLCANGVVSDVPVTSQDQDSCKPANGSHRWFNGTDGRGWLVLSGDFARVDVDAQLACNRFGSCWEVEVVESGRRAP